MTQILASTETTGSAFSTPHGGLVFILLSAHAGGVWKLQVKSPDDEWVDADGDAGIEFIESGYKSWYCDVDAEYRLTGGTAGAKAWISSNRDVSPVAVTG